MSERGNSQDNAPTESFNGRIKFRILALIALCPDIATARRLIDGYLNDYNTKHYQYNLAALTPEEFYVYTQTGVYPLKSYFGVAASELLDPRQLVEARVASARKRNAEQREAYRLKRERDQRILEDAPDVVVRDDQALIDRKLRKNEKIRDKAEEQIIRLTAIREKTETALEFIRKASLEILLDLKHPQNWKNYSELDYINDMNGLFG